jgi:hypothetical protein
MGKFAILLRHVEGADRCLRIIEFACYLGGAPVEIGEPHHKSCDFERQTRKYPANGVSAACVSTILLK